MRGDSDGLWVLGLLVLLSLLSGDLVTASWCGGKMFRGSRGWVCCGGDGLGLVMLGLLVLLGAVLLDLVRSVRTGLCGAGRVSDGK